MADRTELQNQISNRLAQLGSLLTCCYGVGQQWLEDVGPQHRDNILWLASDVCNAACADVDRLQSSTAQAGGPSPTRDIARECAELVPPAPFLPPDASAMKREGHPDPEDLRPHAMQAQALLGMLVTLVAQNNIAGDADVNAPASHTQQALALLAGISAKLDAVARWADDAAALQLQG